ncbi:MAG: cation:proton antiporter [Phycisphaerae bacterium]|nr:cation:proton antiporter [Phycisphaerae bacterium]
MKNRATILYIFMILAGAAGIWAILAAADSMHAPPDLSGTWTLREPDTNKPPISLRIEQSGRFLRVSWNHATSENCKLEPVSADDANQSFQLIGLTRPYAVVLSADRTQLTLRPIGGATDVAPTVSGRRRADAPTQDTTSPEASPADGGAVAPTPSKHHLILRLLCQIAVILAASQLMGRIFEQIRQPKVIGEMVAGIMLGPSLLGWLWPSASEMLFMPGTTLYLDILSQVGVIFFLFLIGLELEPRLLRNRGHTALVVSQSSVITPFLLGGALAAALYPLLFTYRQQIGFAPVALFMGTAMSITAFPVLARILTERNLHKTSVGAVSLTCAAVNDVSAWCILPFIIAFTRSSGFGSAALTAGWSALYLVGMIACIRPLLVRFEKHFDRRGSISRVLVGMIFLLVLLSAAATEAIGIHALFGAFLMGAIMPKSSKFVRELNDKIEDFVIVLLLPIFFAYTGLHTQIGLLNTVELWLFTLLIVAVACAGKFGGSAVAARLCGMNWREASAVGILMNTRGLMELVILNIGRELGVITDAVFAMMVIMAVATTFLTTPILNWVYPDRLLRATRKRELAADAYGILMPVSLPRSAKPLLRLAEVIAGPDENKRNIIALHLRRAEEHEAYRAAINDESAEDRSVIDLIIEQSKSLHIPIEPLAFVSLDPAADIARVAFENQVRLVLMGFHNPVIGRNFLGGTVHRVLQEARTNVGIFIDRGLHGKPRNILVPYLGSPHDKLALELTARIGRNAGAAVTMLHIVKPGRATGTTTDDKLNAKGASEQVFADPTQPVPVTFKVVESDDPIAAVLEYAKPFDLVAIGVAEEWGLTSQLFGWRAERIARDCPSSLLITRRAAPFA